MRPGAFIKNSLIAVRVISASPASAMIFAEQAHRAGVDDPSYSVLLAESVRASLNGSDGSRSNAMNETPARYEFRIWGDSLTPFKERLERGGNPVKTVSTETYLLPLANDECNAKIRAGQIDIKVLALENRGLEQWKPILKAPFPIDRGLITTQICPSLGVQPPQLIEAQYGMDDFLRQIAGCKPSVGIVEVSKTRFQFTLGDCFAEFAAVHFNDANCETVAAESSDPDKLVQLIDEIGLTGMENVSYIRYLKRASTIGTKP